MIDQRALDLRGAEPKAGDEDRIYRMDDELHPRELRRGIERRVGDSGLPPQGIERRSGSDRRQAKRLHEDDEKGDRS